MAKYYPPPPQKSVSYMACPGCGNEAEGEKWANNDYIYETVACNKCQVEWARLNSGEWFILRNLVVPTDSNSGLKISRKA